MTTPPKQDAPTPLTDAVETTNPLPGSREYYTAMEHARTIERALQATRQERDEARAACNEEISRTNDVRRELAEANEKHAALSNIYADTIQLVEQQARELKAARTRADAAEATCAELVTDGNAITLAANLAKKSQECDAQRTELEAALGILHRLAKLRSVSGRIDLTDSSKRGEVYELVALACVAAKSTPEEGR